MRADNFAWKNSIYLQAEDLDLDIHNDYDFRRFSYEVEGRSVSLEWFRGSGKWVDKKLPKKIQLLMTGIDDLRVTPRDQEMPFTEDTCLSSFGYDCDEEWADGQFWVDNAPEPEWRWSFHFQSGMEIQVGGRNATVIITP